MNQSSDAAEQIVRMSLEGFQVAAKVTGSGAKNVAVLIYTIMKNKEQTSGKSKLSNMLKTGKPLTVFSVKQEDLKKFQEEAKRYGILYCALIDKKQKSPDGLVDIVVKKEDAGRINRIVERFKLASYNKAEIVADIQKTKNEKHKEYQEKDKNKVIKEEDKDKYKRKDDKSSNPHLAQTEKSPLSRPISKMQNSSTREGTVLEKKESVKEKLNEYKNIVEKNTEKRREQQKENVHIAPDKKKKNKEKAL